MDLSINHGTLVVTGGPGDSFQNAIVIKKIPRGLSAAGAELLMLEQRLGDVEQVSHDSVVRDGRTYDIYVVRVSSGNDVIERTVYFDVTEWLARVQLA